MNEIFTHFIQLPVQTKGLVIPTPEGDYIVIINSLFASETNKETYRHELRHIMLGHHEDMKRPISEIEKEASDTSLLIDEIVTASLQGLSSPLFPKASPEEKVSVQDSVADTIEVSTFEIEKVGMDKSVERIVPYLSPPDDDPLDILEAVLKNLQETQKELDAYLEEKKHSYGKKNNAC